MEDWIKPEVIASALGVLVVFVWLARAQTPPAVPPFTAEEMAAKRAAYAAKEAERKARARVETAETFSGCLVATLVVAGVGGVLWAAFAIHPGIGIAAIAFGLLALMAAR